MKKLTFVFALALPLLAQPPDLKRNQKVQRLASEVLKEQDKLTRKRIAYDSEMAAFQAACAVRGLDLRPVAGNIMDCVARPAAQSQQQPPHQPPRPAPGKVEAKP